MRCLLAKMSKRDLLLEKDLVLKIVYTVIALNSTRRRLLGEIASKNEERITLSRLLSSDSDLLYTP